MAITFMPVISGGIISRYKSPLVSYVSETPQAECLKDSCDELVGTYIQYTGQSTYRDVCGQKTKPVALSWSASSFLDVRFVPETSAMNPARDANVAVLKAGTTAAMRDLILARDGAKPFGKGIQILDSFGTVIEELFALVTDISECDIVVGKKVDFQRTIYRFTDECEKYKAKEEIITVRYGTPLFGNPSDPIDNLNSAGGAGFAATFNVPPVTTIAGCDTLHADTNGAWQMQASVEKTIGSV
jgi:hypothetical protein